VDATIEKGLEKGKRARKQMARYGFLCKNAAVLEHG